NTPNVNVTNSTTAPLPTRNNDNPARNLVQPNVGCVALVGSLSCSATYSVPIGQTLVIDYIDFMSQVVTATANYSRISVVAGGTSRQFFFEPGSLSGDSSLLMKSGPVQIFADGGST